MSKASRPLPTENEEYILVRSGCLLTGKLECPWQLVNAIFACGVLYPDIILCVLLTVCGIYIVLEESNECKRWCEHEILHELCDFIQCKIF